MSGWDILNTYDLEQEIEEIREELDDLREKDLESDDLVDRLEVLTDLKEQFISSFGDDSWDLGTDLIHDDHFVEYTEQYAESAGLVEIDRTWPFYHIDWADAAEDLKMDYTEFSFDNETYWSLG